MRTSLPAARLGPAAALVGLLLVAIGPDRAAARPAPSPPPVALILDTDIGPDVDDAGAAAILNALADRGEARILAMMACTSSEWGAPCLDAINTHYGRPDVPIGTLKAEGFLVESKYNERVAREFPHDLKSGKEAPDATRLYRQVLAAQPDRSVTLCAVGPLPNLARLLASPPDSLSPLSGRDLVARKVAQLVSMGGTFPQGREFNFFSDAPATVRVVTDWPTPILFSGFEIGARIFTGGRLAAETPAANPVRTAFALYVGPGKDRESWDETAVLAAVRGPASHWNTQAAGHVSVDPATGANRWLREPDRDQSYLVERDPPAAVKKAIEDLMVQPPRRSGAGQPSPNQLGFEVPLRRG
jgi:inosine-uridine nucleoside N-ribohydrolase